MSVLSNKELTVKATRRTIDGYVFYQTVTLNSQSENKSNITVTLKAKGINNFSYYKVDSPTAIIQIFDSRTNTSINKHQVFVERIHPTNTMCDVISWTGDIEHSSNGKLDIRVSTIYNPNTNDYNYMPVANTITTDLITLPDIKRASKVSIENNVNEFLLEEGNTVRIKTNRQSSDFKHTIKINVGNYTNTIATNVTDYCDFVLSLDLLNNMIEATDGKIKCNIICETYNNNSLIGQNSIIIYLILPDNIKPSITNVILTDVGEEIVNNNLQETLEDTYVQGKSKLKIITEVNTSYNSEIVSYNIKGINGREEFIEVSNEYISEFLTETGTHILTIEVTDKRGRKDTTTVEYTCYEYLKPSITKVEALRSLSDKTITEEGTYLNYTFIASVSSLNGKNVGTYEIRYKEVTETKFENKIIYIGNNPLNKTNEILIPDKPYTFHNTKRYDVIFIVNDIFNNSIKAERTLETVPDLLNFNASGKSLAIGKISEAKEEEKKLEIALDTEIKGSLTINNLPVLVFRLIETKE